MKKRGARLDDFSRPLLKETFPFSRRESGQNWKFDGLGYFQWGLKIDGATNSPGALLQYVGVNHGGAHILVA